MFLTVLDLIGTAVFAVSGGFKAVKHELDILGVVVLSVLTGVGGGIVRDLLLGKTPPLAFTDEKYLLLCIAMGIVVIFLAARIARVWSVVKILDAIGLGTFAVIGASQGIGAGLGVVGVIFVGVITACGGGIIRDMMVMEVPAVISRDFYATAAAVGALTLWLGHLWGLDKTWWFPLIAIVLTTGLRLVAMMKKFSLPRVKRIPGFRGSSGDGSGTPG
jgi:uncharacterized membrane protein YeiH